MKQVHCKWRAKRGTENQTPINLRLLTFSDFISLLRDICRRPRNSYCVRFPNDTDSSRFLSFRQVSECCDVNLIANISFLLPCKKTHVCAAIYTSSSGAKRRTMCVRSIVEKLPYPYRMRRARMPSNTVSCFLKLSPFFTSEK